MQELTAEQTRSLRDQNNFIIPILKILKENGGEIENTTQLDRLMTSYTSFTEDEINYSTITERGNNYAPYRFGKNFALKNLALAGLITYSRGKPVKLTEAGFNIDIENIDFERDIYSKSMPYWKKKKEERSARNAGSNPGIQQDDEDAEEVSSIADETDQSWRDAILEKIKALDPYKFEQFSRGLLKKMGFEIDPVKGIQKSGDGGIDGFAYCLDDQSLKTTRVVIQCKRFNNNPVGSPDINNLRGAIDTHHADYGIFITTSYYSKDAVNSSRDGSTPITLIDGSLLVDLMIRYKYKVQEITSYAVDPSFFGE